MCKAVHFGLWRGLSQARFIINTSICFLPSFSPTLASPACPCNSQLERPRPSLQDVSHSSSCLRKYEYTYYWNNSYSCQSSTECLATCCATRCATRPAYSVCLLGDVLGSNDLRKTGTKRTVYI